MPRNRACRRSTIITGIGAGKVSRKEFYHYLSRTFNSCRRLGLVLDYLWTRLPFYLFHFLHDCRMNPPRGFASRTLLSMLLAIVNQLEKYNLIFFDVTFSVSFLAISCRFSFLPIFVESLNALSFHFKKFYDVIITKKKIERES